MPHLLYRRKPSESKVNHNPRTKCNTACNSHPCNRKLKEKARVERIITDQQLVGVSVVCSKTVPQSIVACGSLIVVVVSACLDGNQSERSILSRDHR